MTFNDYTLSTPVRKALDKLGFANPTEIQQRAFDHLLSKEQIDFHGQAQTGTGKTLAFGIPLIEKIDVTKRSTQALIVAPTRELVLQICQSLQSVAAFTGITIESIYGGVPIEPQTRSLRRGVQIVVGTPGRLNDHLRRSTLNLKDLSVLVLDEADIMLDMGFKDDIDEILRFAPQRRQIWLFSATVKGGIQDIKNSHMSNPVTVSVSGSSVTGTTTEQFYCAVPRKFKLDALRRFLDIADDFYGVVFCQTKIMASEVAAKLSKAGYAVGALHGDMSQTLRNAVIKDFRAGKYKVLVATDVAARGIDVNDLTHVINYSFPEDEDSYVHRIGRTGRAGKKGVAITFVERSQLERVKRLARRFKVTIDPIAIPTMDDIMSMRMDQFVGTLDKLCTTKIGQSAPAQKLHDLLMARSPQELAQGMYNMLCQTILKGYDESQNIEFSTQQAAGEQHQYQYDQENLQELAISLGQGDGINKSDVLNYLLDSRVIKAKEINKIRVIQRRTFVMVPANLAAPLLDALRGRSIAGKKARVMYAQ